MRGDWFPLMCFCFIGAILPKVCKTKFSNVSYDIFLPVLKQVMRLIYSHDIYSHDM